MMVRVIQTHQMPHLIRLLIRMAIRILGQQLAIPLADNAGNSNVSNATTNNLTDNAGNSNVSNATINTLKKCCW